ncbi:MAG: GNAT family N-acetyltransferase, partial [Clostridia bacterium]|nr:GNAT family N-acetyltransferase [Clostridia bacterium]
RLLPRFQGSGLGKAAFTAAADFAEKTLGLKVYARCFRENVRSRAMITSSGFSPCCESVTHLYFCRGGGSPPHVP